MTTSERELVDLNVTLADVARGAESETFEFIGCTVRRLEGGGYQLRVFTRPRDAAYEVEVGSSTIDPDGVIANLRDRVPRSAVLRKLEVRRAATGTYRVKSVWSVPIEGPTTTTVETPNP